MNKKLYIPLLTAAIVIPCTAISCGQQDKTCSTIKDHYYQYVYNNTNIDDYISKPTKAIKEQLTTVSLNDQETYKFNDIDYSIDYSRSSWAAAGHLSRALKIAIVAEERNSDELRDIAKKLTLHWVFSNYHNINWWQNELGANNTLANLGLFTFNNLGRSGQAAFNGKIRESSLKWRPSVSTHTGANVFDYIDITCRDAAINNDKEEMDIAFNRLIKEIRNDGIEGFQKDGSFFQHGRQVQNVSYGKSIIRVARTLYQFRNTNYHMPDDKMKILSDYVLKGLRASTFKGYTNYTTVSREHSRINNLDTQANGFSDLAYFIGVDNYPKKDETYNFVESIKKRKNAVSEPEIFYFPVAKMIVANIGQDLKNGKEGIYISYKATEPKLTNTECVNGENRLGLNLSYGTNTCVMDKGDEYFNIAPVMDYNKMPGTTSIDYAQGEASSTPWKDADDDIFKYANEVYGDSLYEGKVPEDTSNYVYNDGQDSNLTFSMARTKHHDRADYTVTCFATKDGVVFLGSDFLYTLKTGDPVGLERNMYTTIDQYITKDDPVDSSSDQSFRNHSDGNVKYTSLIENQTISKKIEKRTYTKEDWKRNNRDQNTENFGSYNVATITLDHVSTPSEVTNYAYAIEPYSTEPSKFKFVKNDKNIHAIEYKDGDVAKIAAAFYKEDDKEFYYDGKPYARSVNFVPGKGAFQIFEKQ